MTGAAPRAQVAILCGGRGTRLGALTANLPKPLLPVGDLPFLDHLLMEVARSGFRDILLLAHFESEAVYRFAESSVARRMFDLNLTLSVEPDPAGTGGGAGDGAGAGGAAQPAAAIRSASPYQRVTWKALLATGGSCHIVRRSPCPP